MSTSSSSRKKVAGATYTETDASYFEKRTLKRSAGVWGLWGLAVAAVISATSRAGTSASASPASAAC